MIDRLRCPASGPRQPPLFEIGDAPVARRINGERVVVLGWARAVLLQLAHPLVAAGVAEHSGFRASPRERLRRFERTVGAMLALTYGPPDVVRRTAAGIDAIHGRVNGRLREAVGLFPAGTPYSARDPELLLWVHATLLESNLHTYETLVGPLTPEERDGYCAEATGAAVLLGVPPPMVPASVAELNAYLRRMYASGRIAVGPAARQLARDLLGPGDDIPIYLDLPFRLPYRLVTAGLLPPALRRAYGLRWRRAERAAFRATVAATRRLVRALPDPLRRWPEARERERNARPAALPCPVEVAILRAKGHETGLRPAGRDPQPADATPTKTETQ